MHIDICQTEVRTCGSEVSNKNLLWDTIIYAISSEQVVNQVIFDQACKNQPYDVAYLYVNIIILLLFITFPGYIYL